MKVTIQNNAQWNRVSALPVKSVEAPTLPTVMVDIDRQGIGWVFNDSPTPVEIDYELREPA